MALRLFAATALLALLTLAPAHAATRIYLMRGLGGLLLSDGMDQIGARLHGRDRTIGVGDWSDAAAFERDALGHKDDLIIVAGHSMGAAAAGMIGDDLFRRGYRVRVIMLDPLFTGARTATHVPALCFYDSLPCRGFAHNVHLPSPRGHIGYASDPRVQARAIAAATAR